MGPVVGLLVLCASASAADANAVDAPDLVDLDLFTGGEGGYACYRLPNLVQMRTPGTILAFVQGDRDVCDDVVPPHHVLMRRSVDNGRTWSNILLVHKDTNNTIIGNPSAIVDTATNTVHLFITKNFTKVLVLSSSDLGRTWNHAKDLTSTLVPTKAVTVYTGLPQGATIRLPGGGVRLMVCANYLLGPGESLKEGGHSYTIYSDDHGTTWRRGESVNPSHMGECSLVQTLAGVIMYAHVWRHDFNNPQRTSTRALAFSSDFGVSFSDGNLSAFSDNPGRDESGGFAVASTATSDTFLAGVGWGVDHYPFINYSVLSSKGIGGVPGRWDPIPGASPLWAGPASYSTVFHPSERPETFFVCYERGNKSAYEVLRLTQLLVPTYA